MNDDFDELKRDYRDIKAPPHLATRVRAAVSDQPVRSFGWLPGAATAMVAIAAVWLLPIAWQDTTVDAPKPAKPSLSALAALKPTKPPIVAPSMTRIQSVSIPRMPAKPKPAQPQSNIQIDNEFLKENDHAHI